MSGSHSPDNTFHVADLQRTARKRTKNYYARAQQINLLFGDVLVDAAVTPFT